MKLTNLFFAVVITAFTFVTACNSTNNKEEIVAKWQMTDISGKATDELPDSTKKEMFKDASIEFKKDGKYVTNGMGGGTKTGIYHFTADEKSLITVEDGSTVTDTVTVVELSKGKLVVEDSKGEIRISFKSN